MADTTDAAEQEVIELGDLDPAEWNDYAEAQGWSDGLPLVMPTESAVERFVAAARGENEPFPPISPRQVVPTLRSLAANAVMAGCRPEYFWQSTNPGQRRHSGVSRSSVLTVDRHVPVGHCARPF